MVRSIGSRRQSTRQGPRSQRCNVAGDGGWRLGANDYIEARVICDKVIPAILPMPKITYNDSSGAGRTVDAELGSTVMETAIRNNIPGIEAECGGACACATCHVYVDEAWREKVGGPSPMEEDMLDFGYDVRPNSRLSCQIKVTEDLDGLVVTTPDKQA
jgi:2Fe-2S ferredoxin